MTGRVTPSVAESLLQLDAAHARHPHVRHEATQPRRVEIVEELLGGSVALGVDALGGDHGDDGLAGGPVIVDDKDSR